VQLQGSTAILSEHAELLILTRKPDMDGQEEEGVLKLKVQTSAFQGAGPGFCQLRNIEEDRQVAMGVCLHAI
jgi:hypothetical protein